MTWWKEKRREEKRERVDQSKADLERREVESGGGVALRIVGACDVTVIDAAAKH